MATTKAPQDGTTVPAATFAEPLSVGTSVQLLGGRPLRVYILWFTLLSIAIASVWGAVTGILLPNQVQGLQFGNFFTGPDAGVDLQQLNILKGQIDAGTATATAEQTRQLALLSQFEAARATSLGLISTIGLIGTMLIQPIVGVISDRTRSRLGRRAPWILFGGLIGSLALVGVRYAPSIVMLLVLWTIAQVIINMALAPATATVADRVPEQKRGTASAMGGMGSFIGGIGAGIGAGIGFAFVGLDFYLIVALAVALGAVGFVVFAKDRSSQELPVKPLKWGAFFLGFTVALRTKDFRWVWIARVLLTFGFSLSTVLSLYMLQSYIQPALSAAEATAIYPLLTLAGFPGTIIAVVVAGRLSDKLGKRKPFVIFASILMAVAMLVPFVSPTLEGMFIQVILANIAFGTYLPVDQALFIDVLPDRESAGRDLGVAALGSNLGQSLGPVLAGTIVLITGGYQSIWIVAAVLVSIAAFAILPVKGAR